MSELVLEKNNQLPDNWTSFQFDKYLIIEYGKGLPKKKRDGKGDIPVYGSSGIDGYHTEYLIKKPCLVIGRKGSIGEVHFVDEPCWAIDTTYFLNEYSMYDLKFLYYLLKHMRLEKLDTSTTVPSLRREDVYKIQMLVPPLKEQKRIVAKIEELSSKINATADLLMKVKQQFKQYRNSLLISAFAGKLTKLWSEQHPDFTTEGLMKYIEAQQKKENKIEFNLTDKQNLDPIPKNWKWTNIGKIEKFVGSGITPRGGKTNYFDSGIPFIRSQNVYQNGLRLDDIVYITNEQHSKMSRTHTQDNDVLLNITGASIGRSTCVPEGFGDGNVNQHVCIIRLYDGISSAYVSYWLNSPKGQEQIFSTQKGQTRQGLNYSQLRYIFIPLCSTEEQQEITNNLEKNLTNVFSIENVIEKRIIKIDNLQVSILKKAFEGKLIPQDPNDEPASVLLEKIKQEKEQLIQQHLKRRKKNVK